MSIREISKKREECVRLLILSVNLVRNSRPLFRLGFLNKFLKSSLFKIYRSASLCGISIGAFLSLGSTDGLLANHPNPFSTSASTQLKSSLPTDFDGDGYMDILDADSSGNLYLIRNSGLSYDKELLLSGYAVEDFAYLDLDQDGDQDFVLLNKEYGSLQVLKNLGSENFLPQNMVQLGSVKHSYLSDLDGDGDSDFAYSTPNMVGWAKNNGSEGFVPQASLDSGLVDVSALDVEDYNGDGKNDLVYSDSSFVGIAVAKNQGSDSFIPQTIGSGISGVSDLEIADLDGDGQKDAVFASQGSSLVGWMKNQGSDNFLPAEILSNGLTSVNQLEVADLDQDGDLDLVASSSLHESSHWLENDGSENFIPHSLI